MKNLALLFALFAGQAFAQNLQFSNWALANQGGLDFNNGMVVPQLSALNSNTSLSTASVSDRDGNLLFYTDGNAIYQRNHIVMPNGNFFRGQGGDFSQNIVIVPNPADANQYFVVAISVGQNIFAQQNGLRYALVDMSLGALGDVVPGTMNLSFRDLNGIAIDENHPFNFGKITTAAHGNGLDYWIVVEHGGRLLSYLVDDQGIHLPILAGISPLPALNHIWPSGGIDVTSVNGPMKMSMNSDRMLIGYSETQNGVFNGRLFIGFFDNQTGLINNLGEIVGPQNAQIFQMAGAEFSESGNIVHRFYDGMTVSGGVVFDPDRREWNITKETILDNADGRIPQRGIDGRIYYQMFDPFLSVIDQPEWPNYNFLPNSTDVGAVSGDAANLPTWVYQQNCVRTLTSEVNYVDSVERERLQWIRSRDFFDGPDVIGIYHAGDFIELLPDFETNHDAGFVAYIEGCSDSFVYRPAVSGNHSAGQPAKDVITAPSLKLYPNPVKAMLTIECHDRILSLQILSIDGKTVFVKNELSRLEEMDVTAFKQGVYIVRIETQSGQILQTKFIKN
ncbi:T9SS type A sorting domain-containing protein [Flavobacterium caeni]|uniref:Por secretion system C-terminal sorting domain-containing protein n=1 Tax=Flavobacterium caeni TaxID=490189 RepID=A0A1G5FE25_9FLAO|nr:T9SS type A sorting domain-containing protein [Flavobacterium caeni]SCY37515.1 Por secretion system C-terminal sorting domain-containing protein [Flavobacterium caeni]